ncbi:MAG: hypothetical protein A2023_03785 [Sulfuricurvum sp. GWF2_44_89]|uniref:Uncharacterized protein n=1 Tax=Sulfuricurvum kujiense TaxID=148813 RepID=A0A2D3WLU8_9BACT|nr:MULTISPECIES: hypothetical protein [Sulfuricurvum]OHD78012.1 MAG: hypothetical protein A2023_03785 [Sulfuricurvum sp. GWF2_44_89]OHD92214.1 MAG: hypothetical protein A2552_10610 [Sulfuricurvum sp. RIFOXYD2_FULL_44_160]OHD96633.1 MAG: hypothetical protein A2517_11385 [Sulfuricurvum sp. RIFOXYD12_FULL_44_77]DAB39286.1 MAG TPA: hypothetical protein CFH83_01565 [Sulfuricurvum kujiense]
MNRILILFFIGMISASGEEIKVSPTSPNATEGKSVYTLPAPAVDVVEEGCVQKEDQNATGYGGAKW